MELFCVPVTPSPTPTPEITCCRTGFGRCESRERERGERERALGDITRNTFRLQVMVVRKDRAECHADSRSDYVLMSPCVPTAGPLGPE